MPYLELPERSGLRTYFVQNPRVAADGTFEDECRPLDPSKPTLVMFHTSGGSLKLSFTGQFSDPRLTENLNLVAFDSRVHGLTTGGDLETYTLEDCADDLLAAIERLDLNSFILLGESHGGAHPAAWVTIKAPERVQALVLVGPCTLACAPELTDNILVDWLPLATAHKDGRGDKSGTISPDLMQLVHDFYFGDVCRNPERRAAYLEGFEKRLGTGHSSHDLVHSARWYGREPIPASELAKVAVPVFILQGGEDIGSSPPAAAEEWKRNLVSVPGGADVHSIAGAPHLLMYMDTSIANRLILGFIQKSLLRSS